MNEYNYKEMSVCDYLGFYEYIMQLRSLNIYFLICNIN